MQYILSVSGPKLTHTQLLVNLVAKASSLFLINHSFFKLIDYFSVIEHLHSISIDASLTITSPAENFAAPELLVCTPPNALHTDCSYLLL